MNLNVVYTGRPPMPRRLRPSLDWFSILLWSGAGTLALVFGSHAAGF